MATLKAHEKVVFERLFDRGGYVLNFTDATYSEFFKEYGIEIDHSKYRINGNSKMKRLRTFWQIESDRTVGTVLEGLLKYAEVIEKVDQKDKTEALKVISRLLGKRVNDEPKQDDFLSREFLKPDLSLLNIDSQFESVIAQRIGEIEKSLKSCASLAVIFLCGSTLEGLLLDIATKNPSQFNTANSAPKAKEGKVIPLYNWTLDNLINVAHETGYIELDIKKFAHELKDFRNYIHPRQQAMQGFNPDKHTAEISWKVLQATIASLSGQRR